MPINNSKLILSPPLQQNFIDPNTRFSALARIYFFKAGTTNKKSVYQRSNDPANPYVVAPNPITLDASGSLPYDIFFYPFSENDSTEKELYDIFVYERYSHDEQENDDEQNVHLGKREIFKRLNWPPAENVTTSNGSTSDDYVVNGQFNYPIIFYNPPWDEVGQIDNQKTAVCFGWQYETDADLESVKRYVTFEEVLNDTFNNLPKYLITIDSLQASDAETVNSLSQKIGPVEDLAGKTVTFAFDGKDASGDGTNIDLVLERNYGNPLNGASETEIIKIDTFVLRSQITQYVKTITLPSLNGKTLVGDTSLTLRFEMPPQTATKVSFTSVIARLGSIDFPEFNSLPEHALNSQIIGQGIDLQEKSISDNFNTLSYFNGNFFFQEKTGTYELLDIDAAKAKQNVVILTDEDQELSVSGSNESGVPYSNLFKVLGTKWGSSGDLQVTSDATSLTFTSLKDGEPFSKENSYSVGNTDWKLTDVQKNNKFGVKVTKKQGNRLEFESTTKGAFSNPFNASKGYDYVEDTGAFYYSYSSDGGFDSKKERPSDHLLLSAHQYYKAGEGDGESPTLVISYILNTNKIIEAEDTVKGDEDNAWKTDLIFLSPNVADFGTNYVTKSVSAGGDFLRFNCNLKYHTSTISYSSKPANVGGTYDIRYPTGLTSPDKLFIYYNVDGKATVSDEIDKKVSVEVKVRSFDTVETLLDKTVKAVNTPFIKKFEPGTFNAGGWIGFGSTSLDSYVWWQVDGVGEDPKPSGRESFVGNGVNLISTDSMEKNLKKIADSITLDKFVVPAVSKVFTIPEEAKGKVVGVIYL